MKFRLTAFAAIAALGMAITPAESKTFRWAFQGDLQTMDPHGLFETMTLGFQRNIYEGLVIRNEKMEMVGALAESWKNIEPTVWRFNLRKSNTEAVVRLNVESQGDPDLVAQKVQEIKSLLNS